MILIIFSCETDDIMEEYQTQESNDSQQEFAVLGKKKQIPFTVENMQRAYENLLNNKTAKDYPNTNDFQIKSGTIAGNYTITTTHKYYKFTPQDSLQYERLVQDSILSVSDIPFEYDVEIEGDKYQAPDMVGTDFTHYYSVVPAEYEIPEEIPHELVANMHFTAEDDIQENPTPQEKEILDFYHDLNLEAEKITYNLADDEKEEILYNFVQADGTYQQLTWDEAVAQNKSLDDLIIDYSDNEPMLELRGLFGTKWNPCGTITTQEDAINQNVGVWDALVKVRKWGFLVIRTAYTNQNGQFQTSSTRTKYVKYAVWFQNSSKRFVVKAGTVFWDAKHRGHVRYKRACWNQHFTRGTHSHFYSLIHNAARDYFSRAMLTFSMHRPTGDYPWSERLKICGKWNSSNSNMWDLPLPIVGSIVSEIRIGRLDRNDNHLPSNQIFGTVTHEMTHAGHYRMDPLFFININNNCERKLIRESWAEAVETVITNNRYNQLTGNNYFASNRFNGTNLRFYNSRRQTETIDGTGGFDEIDEYSPLFIDMVDNINQNLLTLAGNQPVDRVQNYTLRQLQESLKTSRGLYGLKERIKNMHSNSTEGFIDELFNEYAFDYCD